MSILTGGRRRIPVILQATTTECGLASLVMVMAYYGHHVPLPELRARAGIGRDGVSMLALKHLAEEEAFLARAFRVGLRPVVDQVGLPVIAAWDDAHFVVIERLTRRGVKVVDPAVGRMTISSDEFASHYRQIVLRLEPTASVRRRSPRRQNLLAFVTSFVPSIGSKLAVIFGLSLMTAFIAMLPAALTAYLVDSLGVTIGTGTYSTMSIVVVVLALLYGTSSVLRSGVIMWFEKLADGEMTAAIIQHLMRLPFLFFQGRPAGDVLVRLSSISYVRDSLSGRILPMLVDLVFLAVYSSLVGAWSRTHLLVLASVAVVQLLSILLYGPRAKLLADQEVNEMSRTQSLMVEALGDMESTKALGIEEQVFERWGSAYQRQLNISARRQRLDNHLAAFLSTVGFIGPAVLLLVGVHEVLAGRLSLGQMLAVNSLAAAALTPVQQIGMNLQVIQTVRVHLNRLRDLVDEEAEDIHVDGLPADLSQDLVFDGVCYSYSKNGQEVLSDVSLTVRSGEFLAVVGPSGSGKSTLSRLCLGLIEPVRGEVRLGTAPLTEIDLRTIRRQTGVVTQGVTGSAGSIRANVQAGRWWVDDADVIRALEDAALEADVAKMPLGLDTPLGESGQGLSGGQLQRLAIARALAGKPSMVVFDEATSNLDGPAEAMVYARLSSLNATRLVIAHRLSTIANADRILFLVDGRVVGLGPHEELILTCPDYAEFVHSQLLDAPRADSDVAAASRL
ncbi:peptidase domain-containing ABC transporter [Actinomyces sp. Z5]|uniref:peptidase domain-containing ABC transporter n=1 Tax=Actinomyces sp. Z5 TaxID=2250216 RepID=UPI000DCD5FFA|nr:peptidase domain-containing ABC transporter [Actinomyces sp. Z5]RAX19252.1 peptidase domain-containing ABC transporter [Actinomyces sp. Z5]